MDLQNPMFPKAAHARADLLCCTTDGIVGVPFGVAKSHAPRLLIGTRARSSQEARGHTPRPSTAWHLARSSWRPWCVPGFLGAWMEVWVWV